MVKKTKRFKRLRFAKNITAFISNVLSFVPIIFLLCKGFTDNTLLVQNKISLGIIGIAAVVLLIIEIIKRIKLRTIFWLLMSGLCLCITNVFPLIIVFLVCSAVSEFILIPLNKYFNKRYCEIRTARENAIYMEEIKNG